MDGKVEVPILGVIEFGGKEYVCLPPTIKSWRGANCCGCAFKGKEDPCFSVECAKEFREDRQSVIFIENTKRL